MIAHRSSMTATAVKKIFSEAGIRLPSERKTLKANAMSVAIGIPKPFWVGSPALKLK